MDVRPGSAAVADAAPESAETLDARRRFDVSAYGQARNEAIHALESLLQALRSGASPSAVGQAAWDAHGATGMLWETASRLSRG